MTQDTHISLAHGNGGYFMRELIETVFAQQFANSNLDTEQDAAILSWPQSELVITTDGFTVQPLEFPGGNIGSLAVHGTVNDLAVSGAIPCYLTLNVFVEEGFEIALLKRLMASLAEAAQKCQVAIVAGDTKVLPRGQVSGLYLATTGVGYRANTSPLGVRQIKAGDVVLVSGSVGDHGIAVMLAREQFGLRGSLRSDAASVLPLTQALLPYGDHVRVMRDPTRGGVATVLHDYVRATGLTLRIRQSELPINGEVQVVCDMLGYDPLYLACEGRVVAVVAPDIATAVLETWRALPEGSHAALIGTVCEQHPPRVILETELGGERLLEELEDDPLPRIC
jgi:hydrogenase expression/formation protein HypE